MALKYKNKYRIPSARATWWNYSWAGAYFITICTHDRLHHFGKIQNGKMQLSKLGEFAHNFWYEIPNHAKNVELGEFVVMPNHIHGILILNGNGEMDVETLLATSLQSKISPKSNSVSAIIRSYKSAVTKNARHLKPEFKWQARFYDNIIRNEESYQRISHYIKNNPAKWEQDKFFKKKPN